MSPPDMNPSPTLPTGKRSLATSICLIMLGLFPKNLKIVVADPSADTSGQQHSQSSAVYGITAVCTYIRAVRFRF